MPTGVVVPVPRAQFFDDNGDPLAAGKLYAYSAGTSTPLNTYSDSALSTPNANPVVLDSAGRATIYLTPATAYKFILKTSADVTVWTQDNITVATPDASVTKIIAGTGISIAYTGATSGTGDVTVTASTGVPTGSILPFGAAAAPTGYLLCDGTAVSRTTYATLFGVISTLWGVGDGSTTFNVPDLRGKFPLGVATAGTGSTLGGSGGTIDHVHTGPSHTHTGPSHTHAYTEIVNHTHAVVVTDPGHLHAYNAGDGSVGAPPDRPTWEAASGVGNTASATTGITAATSNPAGSVASGTTGASGTGNTGASGTGNTGTGNPPFAAVQFIIKT